MDDRERIARILNTYRDEIMAKSPKSLSIWQRKPHGHAGGCRQPVPAGGSFSHGG